MLLILSFLINPLHLLVYMYVLYVCVMIHSFCHLSLVFSLAFLCYAPSASILNLLLNAMILWHFSVKIFEK